MRYLLLVALAVAAAGLAWFLFSDSTGPRTESGVVEIGAADSTAVEEGAQGEVDGVGAMAAPERQVAAPVATKALVSDEAAAELNEGEHPFAGNFAGVTGRVVEADGAPVPGLEVTLIQLSASALFDEAHVALPLDSLEIGDATTDGDGRFMIQGALGTGFHGLGVDLGGARATLRFIDESLNYSEVRDLGDIKLAESATVFGVVIDDDGEPVEGARVRLAAMPDVVAQSGILEMRSESILVGELGPTVSVVEPPKWIASLVDRLPVSTTYTNADGEFRMEGVPAGRVCGGVDRLGSTATVIAGFELSAGEERDLDELEVLVGRTVTGKVVDAAGKPVAGVEVYGGAVQPLLDVGFLQPAPVTDADGRFTATGVSELGPVVVAARRDSTEPWVTEASIRSLNGVVLRLPSAEDLSFELVDKATGEALEGAEVTATPVGTDEDYGLASVFERARRGRGKVKTASAHGGGLYSIKALSMGRWRVSARVPGYATLDRSIVHSGAGETLRLEIKRGETRYLRVVDADSGEPVVGAHVAVLNIDGPSFNSVASAWTDDNGLAVVGPIVPPSEKDPMGGFVSVRTQHWICQHPSYGRVDVPDALLGGLMGADRSSPQQVGTGSGPAGVDPSNPFEFKIARSVAVSGRVTWAGKPPGAPYMVLFNHSADLSTTLPRLAVTDPDGFYSLKGLARSTYSLELMPRFETRDPMGFLPKLGGTRPLYRERVDVGGADGQVFDVDLAGDGQAKKGWIEGVVSLDGVPIADAKVQIGHGGEEVCRTDAAGRFRTGELEAKQLHVIISGVDPSAVDDDGEEVTYYNNYQTVRSGAATVVEVDVTFRELLVEVVRDEDSRPIVGARVTADMGGTARTGQEGIAKLRIRQNRHQAMDSGTLTHFGSSIRIDAAGFARKNVDEDPSQSTLKVRLFRPVPCAGTVVLPDDWSQRNSGEEWLYVSDDGANLFGDHWIKVDLQTRRFETNDLPPGKYQAALGSPLGRMVTAEFELPPGGDQDLVLTLTEE